MVFITQNKFLVLLKVVLSICVLGPGPGPGPGPGLDAGLKPPDLMGPKGSRLDLKSCVSVEIFIFIYFFAKFMDGSLMVTVLD